MYRWYSRDKPTHINMAGGASLHVPASDSDAFHAEYISQVKSGTKLYLVESRTPLFRFFMDIDYTSQQRLTRDEIVALCHRLNELIPGRCLCATSAPKSRPDGTIKSGIHIHWPELIVTAAKAQTLIQRVPEDLRPFIDDSVYKGSGLRMLWSYKRGDEPPYVPLYDVTNRTFMDHQPHQPTLALFSIQTPYALTTSHQGGDTQCPLQDTGPLEMFIRTYIEGQENARVLGIKAMENTYVVRTDSRYCSKVHREHKSNHVYFCITGRYIAQRCHDSECKGKVGRVYTLPKSVLKSISDTSSES